jgi:hypothetical protein
MLVGLPLADGPFGPLHRKIRELMSAKTQRNRLADRRLWDDRGWIWDLISREVTAAQAEELLRDESVRIGVHDDFTQPLRWISAVDRQRAMKSELKPWFLEHPKPRKHGRFYRLLWISLWGNGARRLLLFDAD